MEPGEASGPGRAIRGLFNGREPEPVQQAPQLPRASILTQDNLRSIAQPVPTQGNLFPEFEQQTQPQVIPQQQINPQHIDAPSGMEDPPSLTQQPFKFAPAIPQDAIPQDPQEERKLSWDRVEDREEMEKRYMIKLNKFLEEQKRKEKFGMTEQQKLIFSKDRLRQVQEESTMPMDPRQQLQQELAQEPEAPIADPQSSIYQEERPVVHKDKDVKGPDIQDHYDKAKGRVVSLAEELLQAMESSNQKGSDAKDAIERGVTDIKDHLENLGEDVSTEVHEKVLQLKSSVGNTSEQVLNKLKSLSQSLVDNQFQGEGTGPAPPPPKREVVTPEPIVDPIADPIEDPIVEPTGTKRIQKPFKIGDTLKDIQDAGKGAIDSIKDAMDPPLPKPPFIATEEYQKSTEAELLRSLQGLESGMVIANENIYQIKDGKPIYKRPVIIGKSTEERGGKPGELSYATILKRNEFYDDGTPRKFDTPIGLKTRREIIDEGLMKKYGSTTKTGMFSFTDKKAPGYDKYGWSSVLKSLGRTPPNVSKINIYNKDGTLKHKFNTFMALHPIPQAAIEERMYALENSDVSNALSEGCIQGTAQTNKDIQLLFESNSPIADTLLILNKGQGRFVELAIENLNKEYDAATNQKEKIDIVEKVKLLANN